MMNKFGKQLAAWTFVSMTVLGTSFMNLTKIHAAEPEKLNTPVKSITPAAGTVVTLNQFVVMDQNSSAPVAKFVYTITGGEEEKDKNGNVTVYSGSDTTKVSGDLTKVSISEAVFSATDKTYTAADATTNKDSVSVGSTQKYVKATFTVDLSSLTFNEPGKYRFKISQSAVKGANNLDLTNGAAVFTNNTARYLDVTVLSDNSTTNDILTVDSKRTFLRTAAETNVENKTNGFAAEYNTSDLTISPTVSGNQSRTDDEFSYTIALFDCTLGTTLNITSTDSDSSNPTSFSTVLINGSNYSTTTTVKVKANQKLTIHGIPKNCGYRISETAAEVKKLGYNTPTLVLEKSTGDTEYDSTNGPTGNKIGLDNYITSYGITDFMLTSTTDINLNYEKNGVIPTGILVTVVPYASIALAGMIGVIVFARRKKSSEEE